MKRVWCSSLWILVLALGCGGAPAEMPTESEAETAGMEGDPADPCPPVGEIQFICDLIGPEDLAVIPDSEWIIASGNQEGGRIHVVNTTTKATEVVFPTPGSMAQHDGDTYPTCPGEIDPDEGNEFRAHGLYLQPGGGSSHTLYVVHHGRRESIEVFTVDAEAEPPQLTWIGCAVTPDGTTLNSVAGLPDGGFATTATSMAGEITSGVLEWQTETGWQLVPGSEDVRPNGIEVSPDGQWLYVAGWVDERFIRLSRGQPEVVTDVVQLGFRPDNLRRGPDGLIYAAGHTDFQEPSEAFNVAWVDPESLEFERILQHPVIERFAASTTAIPIGDELWLGTNRGEMIAYLPMP